MMLCTVHNSCKLVEVFANETLDVRTCITQFSISLFPSVTRNLSIGSPSFSFACSPPSLLMFPWPLPSKLCLYLRYEPSCAVPHAKGLNVEGGELGTFVYPECGGSPIVIPV